MYEKKLKIKWNYLLNIFLIIIFLVFNKHEKKKPKISVFLPIYNKENYIIKSIQSIQNQTLKEIEIVAINDYSSDNSLKKILDLSKEDDRIKVLNNDRNHGLLYSRAMGILNCSGEYFINLDPDDEFNDKYTLEYLYNQTLISNVDIISFDVFDKRRNKIINCIKPDKIQRQKELFYSIFNKDDILEEFLITNKLIKKLIFIKAYEDFEKEIYNGKWNYHEDLIWSILVNKHAKSKLCLNRIVYIYNYNNDSLMNKRFWNLEFQNSLYFLEMFKKLFKSKEEEKYLIGGYLWIINNLRPKFLKITESEIKTNFIKIFQHLLKNYNCTINQRKKINNFLKNIY